jgi:hypothetical protein
VRRLLAALALCLAPALALAQGAAAPAWVPVATYLSDPAHEAHADRARAMLETHGIQSVTTCSLGCTLSVQAGRYLEALTLLDAFVTSQHLDLGVVVPGTS